MTVDWFAFAMFLAVGLWGGLVGWCFRARRPLRPKIDRNITVSEPLTLYPSDIVVIECDGAISRQMVDVIKDYVAEILPGYKVLVLSDGLKLRVVRGFLDQVELVKRRLAGAERTY